MIPSLSALDGSGDGAIGGPVVAVPPPLNFTPWKLPLKRVERALNPYRNVAGNTSAKKNGLRYEAVVQRALGLYENYLEQPAFNVTDQLCTTLVIPDGMFEFNDYLIVVEIKIRHMPEAYWQLEHKYSPALRYKVGPRRRVYSIEVCKSFDPAMPSPVAPRVHSSFGDFLSAPTEGFNVFVWKI